VALLDADIAFHWLSVDELMGISAEVRAWAPTSAADTARWVVLWPGGAPLCTG
jgi:hypothetical protein